MDDICGYGKCSLGISIPILSAANIEVCTIPTSLYTHHTAIEGFAILDTQDFANEYIKQWNINNINFDAIYSGNFANKDQIYSFMQLASDNQKAFVFVDPVMGDFGNYYHNGLKKVCPHLKRLCSIADIITPNITEACLLTDTKYIESFNKEKFEKLLFKLKSLGSKNIVLTGVSNGKAVFNYHIDNNNKITEHKNEYYDHVIHGAGDVFSACLFSQIINGSSIDDAIDFSSEFVCNAVKYTINKEGFETRGISFEPFLYKLTEMSKYG